MKIVSVFFLCFQIGLSLRTLIEPVCKPPRGDNCVDIYKCPYFKNLLDTSGLPRPHHVIKEIRKKQCGFFGKNPAVCCTSTPPPEPIKEERDITVNEVQPELYHKNIQLLPYSKCGSFSMNSRITHGKNVILGEFPWMALIVYNTNNGPDFLCGGTLISERYVLTAAHCILKNIIGVRLGEYNLLTTTDCDEDKNYCAPPVQDFYIEKIEIHASYNKQTDHHDIALIRIAKAADLTQVNVQPICLPLWEIPPVENKLLTVSGWGMTEDGFKSPTLRKASVPVVPLPQCQRLFEGHANISSNQMCAGGQREDSCNGDSGGPLSVIYPVNGVPKFVQYGIVSYGPKSCGTLGLPGIYTKVHPYIRWILDAIRP